MTTTSRHTFFAIVLTAFVLASCSEVETYDPKDTYKYWSGTNPPKDIELIKGEYWQSAHWTMEYIMYLKFKSPKKWWDEFVETNNLSLERGEWLKGDSEFPDWFQPSNNYIRYVGDTIFDQGSRYFRDTLTGTCYIYEIQL